MSSFILHTSSFILYLLAACGEPPSRPSVADAVIDSMAHRYLRTLQTRDLDAIRAPLSSKGKEEVTSLSLAKLFGYFERGLPSAITLIDAETADSPTPTPAERHRLTYRIDFAEASPLYYFFELTIEEGDSIVTGFQIEPKK